MRLSRLLATAALTGLFAITAAAQTPQPAPQPAETPARGGLQGLEDTVGQLSDAPAAETQAPATPTPAAQRPAPAARTPAPAAARPSATPGPRPQPLTRAQIAQLAASTARGRLMNAIARAGLIATQDMLARVPDPEAAGIAGWIAEPEGNSMTVTFYAEGADGAAPVVVHRSNILGNRVVSREVFLTGPRPSLSPLAARMAAARHATDSLPNQACGSAPFNVFVIPPATADGPIDVYQISPQTRRGYYPVGGHFRTTVAADGSVGESHPIANACLELAVPELPAGTPPRPLGAITHLRDPLPTEIHVFLALWTGRPLIIVADDPQRLFAVTGEGIAEIRD
jgi:hypothetical protein